MRIEGRCATPTSQRPFARGGEAGGEGGGPGAGEVAGPPAVALASATAVAARACGVVDRTGRPRPALEADLLIVRADPVRDIGALEAVHTVVRKGRVATTAEGRTP
ncbi:hypothetical protein QLQ12_19345 [Actinoplanes sp. NEAU-A12]|uniref:Amidohydrolase-related domain-containing protein n=1 Tax=Actinoplanes sandaracinus TaxID=3045177 RepID=A0ABT6WM13_9ACTN|nr:hypothetical protein [Actinoplanes sandaracinus]MDI6100770.1 hypothetical protein [Actinoplanes sandaracinus]